MELQTGNFAPDFTIETDNIGTFSLSAQKGKKNVMLYFYPKDDTPGCTIEANDFTKLEKDFARNDTIILGVSKDDIKAHAKFRDKYCLTFPLGFDETGSVCEAYGSWVEKSM
jgi:peroxiredoxin Q/BCP